MRPDCRSLRPVCLHPAAWPRLDRGQAEDNMKRWLLVLIAFPAAVAVWSGWVGLGGLCGFGMIHPLPGIVSGFRLNTAITLPVGVEAYGAYAAGAWLAPGAGAPSPPGVRPPRAAGAPGARAAGR